MANQLVTVDEVASKTIKLAKKACKANGVKFGEFMAVIKDATCKPLEIVESKQPFIVRRPAYFV